MTTSPHDIAKSLHPLERKVLPLLEKHSSPKEIAAAASLDETSVVRALAWLEEKKLISVERREEKRIVLDTYGEEYKSKGLPEKRILHAIEHAPIPLNDIPKKAGIEKEELGEALGILKSSKAVTITGTPPALTITPEGKELLKRGFEEEDLLKLFPLSSNDAKDIHNSIERLKKRKRVIKEAVIKTETALITDEGRAVIKTGIVGEELLENLTPSIIASGSWKRKEFRKYNIEAPIAKALPGRTHPLTDVIQQIRSIFLEMGFQEMESGWVETAFWCMDAMWIPQDHPAREIQDTFYLPLKGMLPDKKLVTKVADAHETGGKTRSRGYGGTWNPDVAARLLLRTHTTATTYRIFASGVQPPAKYFCIGRVFRNEAIDATHLPEFHQVEGFIMGKGLTVKHLMGAIKEFYARIGIHKVKFRPTYNPYTEPSLEALGYSEKLGRWVELINSGVFRPEALAPYGITVPVIAWGLGVERLAMLLYGKTALKELFGATVDLDWIRHHSNPFVAKETGNGVASSKFLMQTSKELRPRKSQRQSLWDSQKLRFCEGQPPVTLKQISSKEFRPEDATPVSGGAHGKR